MSNTAPTWMKRFYINAKDEMHRYFTQKYEMDISEAGLRFYRPPSHYNATLKGARPSADTFFNKPNKNGKILSEDFSFINRESVSELVDWLNYESVGEFGEAEFKQTHPFTVRMIWPWDAAERYEGEATSEAPEVVDYSLGIEPLDVPEPVTLPKLPFVPAPPKLVTPAIRRQDPRQWLT